MARSARFTASRAAMETGRTRSTFGMAAFAAEPISSMASMALTNARSPGPP
jgi:hypothetical protein